MAGLGVKVILPGRGDPTHRFSRGSAWTYRHGPFWLGYGSRSGRRSAAPAADTDYLRRRPGHSREGIDIATRATRDPQGGEAFDVVITWAGQHVLLFPLETLRGLGSDDPAG